MSRFRVEQVAVAVGLSVVGASVAMLILLRGPVSVLSRWVDRKVDEAVTLPAPGQVVAS